MLKSNLLIEFEALSGMACAIFHSLRAEAQLQECLFKLYYFENYISSSTYDPYPIDLINHIFMNVCAAHFFVSIKKFY